jgi:RNA polymerase sigma-70 factor (ECF subfamily)
LKQPGIYVQADDHALIRAFAGGDREAFEALVRRHRDRLFSLCYWFLGDFQEADDVCQEVFIKIFQSIQSFRFESSFATWSYRIAVNACKNRVKSLAYRMKQWTERLDAGDSLPAAAGAGASPERDLAAKEERQAVRKAINTLGADHRAVLVLRDIEGLSYEDIAGITRLPTGTVRSRLARARSRLKDRLMDFYSNDVQNG